MESQAEVGFWSLIFLRIQNPSAGASGFSCQLLEGAGGFQSKTSSRDQLFLCSLGSSGQQRSQAYVSEHFSSRRHPPGMPLPVCFPAAFHPKGSSKKQADCKHFRRSQNPLSTSGRKGGHHKAEGGPRGDRNPHPPTRVRTQMASHPEISIHSLKLKLKKHKPYIF